MKNLTTPQAILCGFALVAKECEIQLLNKNLQNKATKQGDLSVIPQT